MVLLQIKKISLVLYFLTYGMTKLQHRIMIIPQRIKFKESNFYHVRLFVLN